MSHVVVLFTTITATATAQDSPTTPHLDFTTLSRKCAPSVAPATMAAIVKTESNFNPFAIGVNNGARLNVQPKTREEAIEKAKRLIANGYSVDLGLAQISSFNLSVVGLSVEEVFDPCKNLAAAASIMERNFLAARKQAKDDQAALRAALSAYNTGSFSRGFANGYVQKVRDNAVKSEGAKIAPVEQEQIGVRIEKMQRETFAPAKIIKLETEKTIDQTSNSNVNVYDRSDRTVMVY